MIDRRAFATGLGAVLAAVLVRDHARELDLVLGLATESELVVNLQTAQAIGVTIPESLIVEATKVVK